MLSILALLASLFMGTPYAQTPVSSARPPLSGAAPRIFPRDAFPYMRFKQPMDIRAPLIRQNRLYLIERDGRVYHFVNHRETRSAKLFLSLPGRTLLGLAFHPRVGRNRRFFVLSVRDDRLLVSEFRINRGSKPPTVNPKRERVLIDLPRPKTLPEGGAIDIGADGYLYIGLGMEAAKPLTGIRNPGSVLGSLLRINIEHPSKDPEYGAPPANPFVRRYTGSKVRVLRGYSVHAERQTGKINAIDTETSASRIGGTRPSLLAQTDLQVSSIGVGHGGELFLTSLDGRVYELFENKPGP